MVFRQDSSLRVQSVDISVVCTGSFEAEGMRDTFRNVMDTLNCEVDPSKKSYEWPFNLQIPAGGKYSLHGKLLKRLWEVEVTVTLPSKQTKVVDVPLLFVPFQTPAIPEK